MSAEIKLNQNKIKLLKLWEMLKADSDEISPLSTKEIHERLKEQGITCDRRTLYEDIRTLNRYGYEVICELKNRSNQYYVVERGFDIPELRILMDAVTAATFISKKKTVQMHNKIAALSGSGRAEVLKKSQDAENLIKTENEKVYYVVNEIDEAINQNKKVSFQYFDLGIEGNPVLRKEGQKYIVNPIATVFSGDRYYLVCHHDKYENLTNYRIDRMMNATPETDERSDPKWLKNVDITQYKKELFSMYSGEEIDVYFEADNSLIDVVFDKFGKNTKLKDIDGTLFSFAVTVQVSPTFFGWCLGFGERLKITAPEKLRDELIDYVNKIQIHYKKAGK